MNKAQYMGTSVHVIVSRDKPPYFGGLGIRREVAVVQPIPRSRIEQAKEASPPQQADGVATDKKA